MFYQLKASHSGIISMHLTSQLCADDLIFQAAVVAQGRFSAFHFSDSNLLTLAVAVLARTE